MRGKEFDGKLTDEELKKLNEANVSEKDIEKINKILFKYRDHLTGYQDLVGDDIVPGKWFFFNLEHFGYLLEDELRLTKLGLKLRQTVVKPIINKLGPNFMKSNMVRENRNFLKDENAVDLCSCAPDGGITLPQTPVIWTPNHHFKDDALASVITCQRPIYMFFGSAPQLYNTFDGILSFFIGTNLCNRKVKSSRNAAYLKTKQLLEMGADILWCPEGVWNKYPNKLMLHLWPGIYRMCKETGASLVPVVHYIYDPNQTIPRELNPIHTVIDDPIDLANMGDLSEKAALEYYRDIMATWYYLMMEKYGHSKHEEIVRGYANSKVAWDESLRTLVGTCDRLDHEIETSAHYHPRDIVTPVDVYERLAHCPVTDANRDARNVALQLVRECKENDFQSRF